MKTLESQSEQRQIENLSLEDVDMIYSLTRVGECTAREIGRRYRISENDVRKVVDNYLELRARRERKPLQEELNQNPEPSPELTMKKPRKRRSDAKYATAKERQAAYRARLREKRPAAIEQPSLAGVTDASVSAAEEIPVTVCEDPVTEIGPENVEAQHSACHGSSEECYDISESVPQPVTPEACSESEELRLIKEQT